MYVCMFVCVQYSTTQTDDQGMCYHERFFIFALLYILHLFTMYSMLLFQSITVLKGLVYSDHLQVI